MEQVLQVNGGYLAALAVATLFDIVYPIVLAVIVRRRYGVRWRYFLYGALIFFLFQVLTRIPAVQLIQAAIAPQLAASRTFVLMWLGVLALTAGLFEEFGRYIGYRWLMGREEKTWNKAVMYGLGHGGLESMLLVGGLQLLTLINLILIPNLAATFTPEQRTLAAQQLALINATPAWTPLVGAYERFWTVLVQVAFSVIVLQVFRRGSLVWLWLAILAHALLDFVTVGIGPIFQLRGTAATLISELVVTVSGLVAIWVIFKLRELAHTPVRLTESIS